MENIPAPLSSSEAAQLSSIVDPLTGLALSATGMIRVDNDEISLMEPVVQWPTTAFLRGEVAKMTKRPLHVNVMSAEELTRYRGVLRTQMRAGDDDPQPTLLRRTSSTRIIGFSSGKGGVGKSSVTLNVALALAADGQRVGVLDADVYGFSLPAMLGEAAPPVVVGDTVVPSLVHGIHCLSMGYFVDEAQPVIWRGPMLHKAITQLLTEAFWGELDYLLIDMPPGTGDVAMTLAEVVPQLEILVVTTPQPAAQRVAQRSAYAAKKLQLAVRGVVENMSWFRGNDGERYEIFGSGGGEALAHELKVPLLGQIPLAVSLREGGDNGEPIMLRDPHSEAAIAMRSVAAALRAVGPTRRYPSELQVR